MEVRSSQLPYSNINSTQANSNFLQQCQDLNSLTPESHWRRYGLND